MYTLTPDNLAEFRRLWKNKVYLDLTFGQALAKFLAGPDLPVPQELKILASLSYPQAEAWISTRLPSPGQ